MTENCRFCLRIMNLSDKYHEINDEIKNDFLNVTQMELVTSEYYLNVICEVCLRSLQLASSLKKQLIENQEKFYEDYQNAINWDDEKRVKEIQMDYDHEDEKLMDVSASNIKEEHPLDNIVIEHQFSSSSHHDTTCEICFKTFKSKIRLAKHRFTHSDKNMVCSVCGKEFKTIENLKAHIARHGAPKYKCDICGKSYHEKYSLMNHIKSKHLQLKDYKCKYCSKAYFKMNLLNRHVLTIHKKQKFVCGVKLCTKEFNYKHHCKLHIMNIHRQVKYEDIDGLIHINYLTPYTTNMQQDLEPQKSEYLTTYT